MNGGRGAEPSPKWLLSRGRGAEPAGKPGCWIQRGGRAGRGGGGEAGPPAAWSAPPSGAGPHENNNNKEAPPPARALREDAKPRDWSAKPGALAEVTRLGPGPLCSGPRYPVAAVPGILVPCVEAPPSQVRAALRPRSG